MVFYFSGTGNSRWVATMLGDALHEDVVAMTDFLSGQAIHDLSEGERLGLVFPVHAWGPPAVVLRFIEKLMFDNRPDYVCFVCTCGDDTGKTSDLFIRAIRQKGWVCQAGFSITMPNTYVCLPGFDVDSGSVEVQKLRQAACRMSEIIRLVEARQAVFDCHEGGMPRIKSYWLRPLFNRFLMSPSPFHAKETCISCGKCEQVCPLHNIQISGNRPQWGQDCTMCLACYHHCPVHAIRYGRQTEQKGQYTREKRR